MVKDRCLNCGKILPNSVKFEEKEDDTEDAWLLHKSWLELHLDEDVICSKEIADFMFVFLCPDCIPKLTKYLRKKGWTECEAKTDENLVPQESH